MINKESIISLFNDKPTLLEWLKKVEEALKNASAVSFKVNKKGNATLTFSIVFDDGSEIESDAITLQQGESVQSAYIQNGNLHLVLTNGDDLNAGNMFNGDITLAGSITAASIKTPSLTSDAEEIAAQKPVVEVMAGYSVRDGNPQINLSYFGISKNGKKLTIAYSGSITPTSELLNELIALRIVEIPSSIGSKIIPQLQNRIVCDDVMLVDNTYTSSTAKRAMVYVTKWSDVQITIYLAPAESLTIGTTYYLRGEITFLLSDNLAA